MQREIRSLSSAGRMCNTTYLTEVLVLAVVAYEYIIERAVLRNPDKQSAEAADTAD